jgi:hypothetical protein
MGLERLVDAQSGSGMFEIISKEAGVHGCKELWECVSWIPGYTSH